MKNKLKIDGGALCLACLFVGVIVFAAGSIYSDWQMRYPEENSDFAIEQKELIAQIDNLVNYLPEASSDIVNGKCFRPVLKAGPILQEKNQIENNGPELPGFKHLIIKNLLERRYTIISKGDENRIISELSRHTDWMKFYNKDEIHIILDWMQTVCVGNA